MATTGDISTPNNVIKLDGINAEAGSLSFNTIYNKDGSSVVWNNYSSATFQDGTSKSFLKFMAGGGLFKTYGDYSLEVGGNKVTSVRGAVQDTVQGDRNHYTIGDKVELGGDHGQAATDLHAQLKSHLAEIQTAKINAYEQTKGDKVECPVCSTKIAQDRASEKATAIARTIGKYFWPPKIKFPMNAVQFILSCLIVPFMSSGSAIAAKGGKNCSNPSCENGMIETSSGKTEAANAAADELWKIKTDDINKLEQQLSVSSVCEHHKGSFSIIVGSGQINDLPAYAKGVAAPQMVALEKGKDATSIPVPSSPGSCIQYDSVPPDMTPGGEYHIVADNKVSINAGAHGIVLGTNGHSDYLAGSMNIIASDGTLNLASKGKTVLKGANIKIDANDGSGDHGLEIDAKKAMVKGQLSVTGDLVVTGTITCNGNVSTPNTITRGMTLITDPASSPHYNGGDAIHNSTFPIPNGVQATVYNTIGKTLEKIQDGIDALNSLLTLSWLFDTVQTAIQGAKMNLPVTNTGIPTGYAMVYDCTTYNPLMAYIINGPPAPAPVYGTQVTVVGAGAATITGFAMVQPACIPVWTQPHVHSHYDDFHTHAYATAAGSWHGNIGGINSATPAPSHIPSPASAPMASTPSAKDLPSSCGGGGAFSFPPTKYRNQAYNIEGDEFKQSNYVDAKTTFTPDGNLVPPAESSLKYVC